MAAGAVRRVHLSGVLTLVSLLTSCGRPILTAQERKQAGCELLLQRLEGVVKFRADWRLKYPKKLEKPELVWDHFRPSAEYQKGQALPTVRSYCPQLAKQFPSDAIRFVTRASSESIDSEQALDWITYWQFPVVNADGTKAVLFEDVMVEDGSAGGGHQYFLERRADGHWQQTGTGISWSI